MLRGDLAAGLPADRLARWLNDALLAGLGPGRRITRPIRAPCQHRPIDDRQPIPPVMSDTVHGPRRIRRPRPRHAAMTKTTTVTATFVQEPVSCTADRP